MTDLPTYTLRVAGLSKGQAQALYASLIGVGVDELYDPVTASSFSGLARAFSTPAAPVVVEIHPEHIEPVGDEPIPGQVTLEEAIGGTL